jgi:hypothetical protein
MSMDREYRDGIGVRLRRKAFAVRDRRRGLGRGRSTPKVQSAVKPAWEAGANVGIRLSPVTATQMRGIGKGHRTDGYACTSAAQEETG